MSLLFVLFALLFNSESMNVYADEVSSVTINLPVKQSIDISGGKWITKNVTFEYYIEAVDKTYPLPKGNADGKFLFSMKGDVDFKLDPILFTESGVYEYKVYQAKVNKTDLYTQDNTVYTIKVYVKSTNDGKLVAEIIGDNGEGKKPALLEFSHKFIGKDTDVDAILTGDSYDISHFGMLFISFICAVLVLHRKRDNATE